MERYIVTLDKDHMLSVLGTNIELPYRYQNYLNIVVPYQEYVEFVKLMLDSSMTWLSFNLDMYKNAWQAFNEKLMLRLYYLDVSKAQLNEFKSAVKHGADGTIITHFIEGATKEFRLEDINNCIKEFSKEDYAKGIKSLKNEVSDVELSSLSLHNVYLFNYILYMRILSYQANPERVNVL